MVRRLASAVSTSGRLAAGSSGAASRAEKRAVPMPGESTIVSDVREFLLSPLRGGNGFGWDRRVWDPREARITDETFDPELLDAVAQVFRRVLGVRTIEIGGNTTGVAFYFGARAIESDGDEVDYRLILCWYYPVAAVRAFTWTSEPGSDEDYELDVSEGVRVEVEEKVLHLSTDLKSVLEKRNYVLLPYNHPAYQQRIPYGRKDTRKVFDYFFRIGMVDQEQPTMICGQRLGTSRVAYYDIPEPI